MKYTIRLIVSNYVLNNVLNWIKLGIASAIAPIPNCIVFGKTFGYEKIVTYRPYVPFVPWYFQYF